MNTGLFIGIMGALSTFYLVLGWKVSKNMKSHTDLFLAGRNLGIFSVTATLLATQIGGGMFVGTAQDPFRGILYVIGMVIGFLILGLGVAERFRAFNVETVGGIFTKQYNSPSLRTICELLSVVTLCGILLSQALATKSIISTFTSSNSTYLFPGLWMVIVAYTLMGGLQAVVITDLFQVGIIMAVFIGLFFYSLWANPISFFSSAMLPNLKSVFAQARLGTPEILRIAFVSTLYSVITQDIAQRFFASKTKSVARQAALYASIILLAFSIIPFYFGILASIQGLAGNSSPLFSILETLVSGLPLVLAICALMAAITSTIDSLLCTVAAIICSLSGNYLRGIKHEIKISQLIILLCGVSILVGSFYIPKQIISVLIDSYEISVVCLVVPILFACFKKKENLSSFAALLSVIGGLGGFLYSKTCTSCFIGNWGTFIAVGLSLAGYLIGDLLNPKK